MELLEHEPDALGTQRGAFPLPHAGHRLPIHEDRAPAGLVEGAKNAQQGALPRPGRADDRDLFAGHERQ